MVQQGTLEDYIVIVEAPCIDLIRIARRDVDAQEAGIIANHSDCAIRLARR